MQVVVSGKHLDVGSALRSYIEEHVSQNIKKYFENAIHAHITISKEGNQFHTDILVNEGTGTGVIIKSNANDHDPYKSVEFAIGKMEAQLRRYKVRIKHHRKNNKIDDFGVSATKYVLCSREMKTNEEILDEKPPVIIAEKAVKIDKLSVRDAVMMMDLLNLPTYLFVNSMNQNLNLVYYRKDGNIAWVDSGIKITDI